MESTNSTEAGSKERFAGSDCRSGSNLPNVNLLAIVNSSSRNLPGPDGFEHHRQEQQEEPNETYPCFPCGGIADAFACRGAEHAAFT